MNSHRQTLGQIWSAAASGARRRFGVKQTNWIDTQKALSPLRSANAVQTIAWLFVASAISTSAQTNSNDTIKLAPPLPLMQPTFWDIYHWWIIIAVVLLLLPVGILLWAVLKPKPTIIVPPVTVARDALGKLAGRPEDGACFSRTSQIVRHYFIATFQLPDREMTTVEMAAVMAANEGLGVDLGSRVSQFLLECDRRKFAPQPGQSSGAVQHALALVDLGEGRRVWQLNHLRRR